jgi:hypothetical protein
LCSFAGWVAGRQARRTLTNGGTAADKQAKMLTNGGPKLQKLLTLNKP